MKLGRRIRNLLVMAAIIIVVFLPTAVYLGTITAPANVAPNYCNTAGRCPWKTWPKAPSPSPVPTSTSFRAISKYPVLSSRNLVQGPQLTSGNPGNLTNSKLDHFGPFSHPDIPSSRTVTNNGPNPLDR